MESRNKNSSHWLLSSLNSVVGVRGFEPPASTSRTHWACAYSTVSIKCPLVYWDKFGTRDMGTITKRGELQWQAKVRRRGFPTQSRTFSYKEDAEKWVRAVERELETSGFVDRREAEKNTFGDVLRKYQKEVTPSKKSADIESIKIDVILKDAVLPKLKMSAITSTAVASWRDRRLKAVSGATVNREIDVLSTVLNHARREWGIHVDNPIPYVKDRKSVV